jgi:hypothetical protein
MKRTWIAVPLALALCAGVRDAHAQQTTERFIPVGQSPGISGTRSYQGAIVSVNLQLKTFTVRDAQGPRTIRVAPGTRIWLDRSAEQRTSAEGSMTDLEVGRRVEVLYMDDRRRDTADWIKVVVASGQ